MSYDLKRIVLTFVPSFDPCSQLPQGNPTSSAAPDGCSLLFISTRPTNKRWLFSILYISPKTDGLMSCSLLATPFLCCFAANLHTSCLCVVCARVYTLTCVASTTSLCSSPDSASLHHHCLQHPLTLHPSVPHSRHCHSGPEPGWTFEWRDRWTDWSKG